MNDTIKTTARAPSVILSAGLVAVGQIVLTIAHHLYGAVIYESPFRAHVVLVALPVGVAIVTLLYLGRRLSDSTSGTWLLRVSSVVMAVLLAAMIGLYEGGYNHVLKDIVYFAGLPADWFDRFFPPPLYEKPTDLIFELTGMLQFPVGLLTASQAWRLWLAAGRRQR